VSLDCGAVGLWLCEPGLGRHQQTAGTAVKFVRLVTHHDQRHALDRPVR